MEDIDLASARPLADAGLPADRLVLEITESVVLQDLDADKSFIDRVATDEQGASVTEAIIAMSHAMKLSTVAEGVEVAEQAAWLHRAGCTVGQGYFWSRPVDLAGVQHLLATSVAGSPTAPPSPSASLIAGIR
jgi:EAL domain-containing protein (putative c-di-GMP-specific phosphodiesterase class I)